MNRSIYPQHIPNELQETARFLLWKMFKNKDGKQFKSPISHSGYRVGYDSAEALMSFEAVKNRISDDSDVGIGISLGDELEVSTNESKGYLWCLDFDGFAEKEKKLVDSGVMDFIEKWPSYAEMSPSQTGFKVFFVSNRPPTKKFKFDFGPSEFAKDFPDVKKYRNREIEVFSRGCFLAMTGQHFNSSTTSLRCLTDDDLDEMLTYLDEWAKKTGGTGTSKDGKQELNHHDPDTSNVYTKLTVTSLVKVLAHVDNTDEQNWTDVANALARVYGEDALSCYQMWSAGEHTGITYDRYDQEECDARFNRALNELKGKPDGYGIKHLIGLARENPNWGDPVLDYETDSPFTDIANSGDLEKLKTYSETGDGQQLQNQAKIINLSDLANGKRYATEFRGQIKFIRDTSKSLIYDETKGWVIADSDHPIQAAKMIVQQMAVQASEEFKERPTDDSSKRLISEVRRTSKEPAIKAMISLARSEDGMSVGLGELDADNYLLGTLNGVIDLRTGELIPPDPSILVTKRINAHYDPDAGCPRYQQFLQEAIPNIEEREFLIRWNGYCLSGSAKEQKLLFLKGSGANGKTVYVENTKMILGDYADKIQTEMLMRQYRSSQAASPDLVGLQGRRFIYCNETTEGQRLDDARVKDLTGGDTITGRMPYAVEAISFSPTHKVVIAGNHAPVVTDDGDGMWRRMILFPFTQRFEGRDCDPDLLDKLWLEASGILNLWLEGFVEWNNGGLQVPASLARATNAYRDEQDLLLDWMNEKCEVAPNLETDKLILFAAYKEWCEHSSYRNLSKASFSRKLTGRGFKVTSDKRKLIGIGLKDGVHFAQLR